MSGVSGASSSYTSVCTGRGYLDTKLSYAATP